MNLRICTLISAIAFASVPNFALANEDAKKVHQRAVKEVIAVAKEQAHECQVEYARRKAVIIGKLDFYFKVDSRGQVGEFAVGNNELTNDDFIRFCVWRVFQKQDWPKAPRINNAPYAPRFKVPFSFEVPGFASNRWEKNLKSVSADKIQVVGLSETQYTEEIEFFLRRVDEKIRSLRGTMNKCYDDMRDYFFYFEGLAVLQFTLDGAGKVQKVEAVHHTIELQKFIDVCLIKQTEDLQFSGPPEGLFRGSTAQITYPLYFKSY